METDLRAPPVGADAMVGTFFESTSGIEKLSSRDGPNHQAQNFTYVSPD